MHKFNLKLESFKQNRLIYEKSAEKPSPALSDADKKKGQEVLDEATKKARDKAKAGAIEQGKAKAVQGVDKQPQPPRMPEVPTKLAGLKFDSKDAKPNPANGTIEQPFQFGDLKIKGTIVMPDKPDSDPKAKTTYVFNYVDDPSKFDNAKFLEKLKAKKADLGNTVIITLRTPEGETKINGEKVNTMEKLLADVEKFQADLPKDPKFAAIKMARAENILHMTDEKQAQRVGDLLTKFAAKASENDSRLLKYPRIINATTPETFTTSLEAVLAPAPEVSSDQPDPNAPEEAAYVPGKGSGGGGGGMGGGGGGMGGGQPAGDGGGSPAPAPSDAPVAALADAPENKERGPGVNKMLVIGDSLMVGAKDKLRANFLQKDEETVKGGRQLSEMLSRLKKWDTSGKMEEFRNETMVIDGGLNDLGSLQLPGTNGRFTQEKIFSNMQEVWKIAKKYNMRVCQCTLPPFGGTSYKSMNTHFEERNAARIWLNQQIRASQGSGEGPADIIGLDLPVSQGGMADENDINRIDAQYRAGDGIHYTGKGYENMAAAIQKVVGEPISGEAKDPGKVVEAKAPQASGAENSPGKIENFHVTPADRQAADNYLAEVKSSSNPEGRIGETKLLPGGDKILKVAWHANHTGQWGTPSLKIIPGMHIGVQVEPNKSKDKLA